MFGFDLYSDTTKMAMNFYRIVRVTGDATWVSFVNAETKEQFKQWMHTHTHTHISPN
jgi:hypothetical protein